MAAGRPGAPFGIIPGAALTQAGAGFGLDQHLPRLAGLPLAAPALATGAAFAVNGLNQHVFALRQLAITGAADTTGPPLAIQCLMPFLTLYTVP